MWFVMLMQGFVFQCGVEVHNRENLSALSVTKRTLSTCSYERPLLYFYITLWQKQNVDSFSLIVWLFICYSIYWSNKLHLSDDKSGRYSNQSLLLYYDKFRFTASYNLHALLTAKSNYLVNNEAQPVDYHSWKLKSNLYVCFSMELTLFDCPYRVCCYQKILSGVNCNPKFFWKLGYCLLK